VPNRYRTVATGFGATIFQAGCRLKNGFSAALFSAHADDLPGSRKPGAEFMNIA
jgi:hypothetical protein